MTEVPTRGLTFYKLECVRELLHQLCADEEVPSSLTARLMAERGVTTDDVMRVCRVAEDALEAHRTAEMRAARADESELEPMPSPVPLPQEPSITMQPPVAQESDYADLRAAIEANRAKALTETRSADERG
jgi:hypothetical protein